MSIGQRKQVQLVQIVTTKQAAGNWGSEQEGIRYGCWAEIRNPSGQRNYSSGQTQLSTTKIFKVRFRFDKFPDADWKIKYEDKNWTISSRQALQEKRFYWEITATSEGEV